MPRGREIGGQLPRTRSLDGRGVPRLRDHGRADGRGGYCRGRGHVAAGGGVASADKATRMSVGDIAVDEVAGGT